MHVTLFAEGLITEVYKRRHFYIVHRVGKLEYEVAFDDLSDGVESDEHGLSNNDDRPKTI